MAWTIVESRPLTQTEMLGNAQEFINYFLQRGYSENAVKGMITNVGWETTVNPGRWQSEIVGNFYGGFGLVQWTPATNYIDWATSQGFERTNPTGQMIWIDTLTGQGQWIPTSTYNLSWDEYKTTTQSPEWCVEAFMYCFERPGIPHLDKRLEMLTLFENNLDWSGSG